MPRYVVRMFADEWRQWSPSIAVVAVIATMIGVCVHQFAWTSDPAFRAAVTNAGVPIAEFQILSVTIYTVIALVSWVSLTVVGRASVHVTRSSHALWLLMGPLLPQSSWQRSSCLSSSPRAGQSSVRSYPPC